MFSLIAGLWRHTDFLHMFREVIVEVLCAAFDDDVTSDATQIISFFSEAGSGAFTLQGFADLAGCLLGSRRRLTLRVCALCSVLE